MCKFRSYVVTRTEVLGCSLSDSHTDIIQRFGLKDDSEFPDFVRVELEVRYGDYDRAPVVDGRWYVSIDQDYRPPWFNYQDIADRTRQRFQHDLESDSMYLSILKQQFITDLKVHRDKRLYVARIVALARFTCFDRVTEEQEPDAVIRAVYAGCCKFPERQLTAADEPSEFVRIGLATRSASTYPLTASEEPCEDIRYAYLCRWRKPLPDHRPQRLLTREEEPSVRNRLLMWSVARGAGMPVKLPAALRDSPIRMRDMYYDISEDLDAIEALNQDLLVEGGTV